MAISLRFKALDKCLDRVPLKVKDESLRSESFGQHVFTLDKMRLYVSKDVLSALEKVIDEGADLAPGVADQIGEGMKQWALSNGVTHYTHWFQPLTGLTAEKHDAFMSILTADGKAIEQFSGGQLIQQEPDASSFPNGGIRNTFEARGYTAWDPSSPAFIFGTTLCIPTIFVSYTGEALDNKTPLLRAIEAVNEAATDVVRYFDKSVKKVMPTLGCEQEYFLVDKSLANARPDLVMAGRAMVGHEAAKNQQLDDHYFGSIPARVLAFMRDLEQRSNLLGIPLATRHNEVAPGQFELAPDFEELNVAVDHNILLMDLMAKVAEEHNFKILLHEKPFAKVNGSGKHNNWSLMTDKRKNLLSPGKTPTSNLQFLTFFINIIKAVHNYEELIRSSIASAANDHRLGANEAPPAIMSVFIGSYLTEVLNNLENVSEGKLSPEEKTDLKLNIVGKIPNILLDNTDRNRTSPFAFTGNKFEFRAVGSSDNSAKPMMVLNTVVASQLKQFKKDVDALIEGGAKKDDAIFNILRNYIKESKTILFEGNGYSQEWADEAAKRGLSNHKTTPEALKARVSEQSIKLFEDMGVLNVREVEARYEIELENYSKKIQIEARILDYMVKSHIIPAVIKYQNTVIKNIQGLKEIFGAAYETHAQEQIKTVSAISKYLTSIGADLETMLEERRKARQIEDHQLMAEAYCNKVKPLFDSIRYATDKLELIVDDQIWPMIKYREMLFLK